MSVGTDKAAVNHTNYDKTRAKHVVAAASTKRKSSDGSGDGVGGGVATVTAISDRANRFRDNYGGFSVSPTTDYYIQQLKYNEVTRYQPNNALYLWQRRRANKSVPNIVQAFGRCDHWTAQAHSDQLFGERIFSVNKSNAFAATNRGDNCVALMRDARTPTHEIQQFTRFATKSAARESIAKKMCRHGTACAGCQRCQVTDDGHLTSAGDSSRVTITTLSRKSALPSTADNRPMPRNPGVLIAVRDWSKTAIVAPLKNDGVSGDDEQDECYERLRQTGTDRTIDGDRENGPVYAMVNKEMKTKNVQPIGRTTAAGEQTKFTYIGISPTGNSKAAKTDTELIEKQTQQNSGQGSTATLSDAISMNSVNNNGIPVNECVTMSTGVNPDFSTKIWKGAKKAQNEAQKM